MAETFSPRRATSTDAPAIRNLSRMAYAKWVPLIGREPLPMTADYNRAIAKHIIDLVEQGGELLALIEMVAAQDHLLIENIAVRPDQQGRGLGDLLLRHAETLALSMKLAETQLYTNALFASNLAYYAKRGYAEYRRQTMASGSTAVFMRKKLTGEV
jgi:N-acetylglutamate synthase-like GNAT family acetyltransferase